MRISINQVSRKILRFLAIVRFLHFIGYEFNSVSARLFHSQIANPDLYPVYNSHYTQAQLEGGRNEWTEMQTKECACAGARPPPHRPPPQERTRHAREGARALPQLRVPEAQQPRTRLWYRTLERQNPAETGNSKAINLSPNTDNEE
jgi:hypothetical protein